MSDLTIRGGRRLSGRVAVEGNKNAALPLLAACVLTAEPCRLIDQVQGADLVFGPPATPVADPGGYLGESGGNGHARTVAPRPVGTPSRARLSDRRRGAILRGALRIRASIGREFP